MTDIYSVEAYSQSILPTRDKVSISVELVHELGFDLCVHSWHLWQFFYELDLESG